MNHESDGAKLGAVPPMKRRWQYCTPCSPPPPWALGPRFSGCQKPESALPSPELVHLFICLQSIFSTGIEFRVSKDLLISFPAAPPATPPRAGNGLALITSCLLNI